MKSMAPLSSSSQTITLIILVTTTCLAETVSLRGAALRDRSIALSSWPSSGANPVDECRFFPPASSSHNEKGDEIELLDITLVASVDGKFHALNRTSGRVLWSMPYSSSSSSPSALSPLVRTHQVDPDPDDTEYSETYIIEPQTGDIFVLSAPDAPLQRLALSMPQLVDLSPFAVPGEGSRRVFVGKKETSLLTIELETGRVKGAINSDSECPWGPFRDFSTGKWGAELDLDELDSTKPEKPVSTEVLIRRTDYHITIQTRSLDSSSNRPRVQNLSFSTYGPNDQDHAIQAAYRRTPDDSYIQPLPSGAVLSFRVPANAGDNKAEAELVWSNSFKSQIVAVFDVVTSASREHPFVLTQPRRQIQDAFPIYGTRDRTVTYVGLVKGTGPGSLFAMSAEQYPLVAFQSAVSPSTTDTPPGTEYKDPPGDVYTDIGLRMEQEHCRLAGWDKKCLTGVRRVDPGLI